MREDAMTKPMSAKRLLYIKKMYQFSTNCPQLAMAITDLIAEVERLRGIVNEKD